MSDQHYCFPLDEVYSHTVHTNEGVKALVERSHLMTLLREMAKDGHDVSGPAAELVALMNYVTSSQMSMRDLQMHLDYCAAHLREQLR